MPASIDETPKQGISPGQKAEDIALRKVMTVAGKLSDPSSNSSFLISNSSFLISNSSFLISNSSFTHKPQFIFAADTIVVLEGKIYGKAADRAEAEKMLKKLAGKKHEVITAMVLYDRKNNKTDCRSVSCEVEFAPMTADEIEWYLDTNEWSGAAGSYRLQEKGGCFIKSIKGSPSAVAGLSLKDFYDMLRDNGYHLGA